MKGKRRNAILLRHHRIRTTRLPTAAQHFRAYNKISHRRVRFTEFFFVSEEIRSSKGNHKVGGQNRTIVDHKIEQLAAKE